MITRELIMTKLKEGMEFKNYKELCKYLGIKVLGGEAKKVQLKQLESYCKIGKQGYKLFIIEIYKEPLAIIDNRLKGNNSIYIKEIGNIILEYLYKNGIDNRYNCILSLGQLMEILGIVNPTYSIGNRHKKELSQILDINLVGIYYFYSNTRNEFKRIIERALNNLRGRRVLNWNLKIVICKKDKDNKKYYVNATKEEEELIIDIEKEGLKYLGLNNMREVFLKGKMREYQSIIKKELYKDWVYYFYAYDLTVGAKAINIEYNDIKKEQIKLNNKIKNKTYKIFNVEDEKNKIHKQLTDILISIVKHDLELDNQIIERYHKNIENKNEEINTLEMTLNNIRIDKIEEIESRYNDIIDIKDYIDYSKEYNKK